MPEDKKTSNPAGGPIQIKINIRDPGVVVITFEKPVDTLVLNPLEALNLCQVLLQKSIMIGKGVRPQGKSESRIVKPDGGFH